MLIDDGDTFVEYTKSKANDISALITKAKELGITVITTTPGNKLKGFDPVTTVLKDVQAGVVLGSPDGQMLLPVSAPTRYKATLNMGFWCKRGTVRQVKLPLIT